MSRTKEGSKFLAFVTSEMLLKIRKGCYCRLRNFNFTTISKKVQMIEQEYLIHEVSTCVYEEYTACVT
jgi:hypothetical protein